LQVLFPALLKERGAILPSTSPFYLNDPDTLSEDLKSAGFTQVKYFYAPMNPTIRTAEEYL